MSVCPHCKTAFHANTNKQFIEFKESPTGIWELISQSCPQCRKPILELRGRGSGGASQATIQPQIIIYPTDASRITVDPSLIPPEIYTDYSEACKVLPISTKASAALARRCIQQILRGLGYNQKDLVKQIEAYIAETNPKKAPSQSLSDTIDAVRNFGNFSAHPITDLTTLQIVDVENDEAEWCLEIVEELFDHCYVKPAKQAAKKASLDAKLAAAGKPPSK